MHSASIQRLVAATLAGISIGLLPGCGRESEAGQIASAKGFLEKKDPKSALIQLKAVLQKDPQSGEARYLLGRAFFDIGDVAAAALELEKARSLKYSDDLVLPLLVKSMTIAGQAKKVTDLYGQAKLKNPAAAADLQAALAYAYGAQGLRDRSQAAVDAALRLDPKNATALVQGARLAGFRGATDEALRIVDGVLASQPKRLDAWQLKGELLLGGKHDRDGAAKAFKSALAVEPKFLPAHLALISMLLEGNDIPAFRAQVDALKKALPNSGETRFYETHLALMDGNLKAADQGVQQLLVGAPESPRVLQLAGTIALRSGSLLLADKYFNKALTLSPDLAAARRSLVETYLRSGLPAKALSALQPLLNRPKPDASDLVLAAEAYLQDGDPDKAELLFSQAAKADPGNPMAQTALALASLSTGNPDAGFARLESIAAHAKDTVADMALVNAHLRRRQFDAALKAIDRLQEKLPDRPLPFLLRSRALEQKKDFAGARATLEKALALDPVYFPAISSLAALDVRENKPEDARKRFDALLAKDPKDFRALLAVAELRQRAGAQQAEIDGLLTEVVKLNPSEPGPRQVLIDRYLALGRAKAGRTAAEEAVAALPDNMQLLDALGRAQLATGDVQLAINTFAKSAAAQATNAGPLLLLAQAYAMAKDYVEASKALRRALDISPNLLVAQRGLVEFALAGKHYDEAMAVARDVQKQRPKSAAGFLLEAEVHLGQKRTDQAIAAVRAAFERSETTEIAMRLHTLYIAAGRGAEADRFAADWERKWPRDAEFQMHMGAAAISRKDFAAAESRFRRVLAIKPDDMIALNDISWLMVQQAKPGALEFVQRALEKHPKQASLMDTMATVLASDNQLQKALEWQRKAVATAPDEPYYRLGLAKLLVKGGDKVAARAELESLVKLGGRFPAQAEVASLLKQI